MIMTPGIRQGNFLYYEYHGNQDRSHLHARSTMPKTGFKLNEWL